MVNCPVTEARGSTLTVLCFLSCHPTSQPSTRGLVFSCPTKRVRRKHDQNRPCPQHCGTNEHPHQGRKPPSRTLSQTALPAVSLYVSLAPTIFNISHVAAHLARNPKAGEPVQVPATHYPTFRAGKTLKAKTRSFMLIQKTG